MFLGPMDYSPGAMRNATRQTFAPINLWAVDPEVRNIALYVR